MDRGGNGRETAPQKIAAHIVRGRDDAELVDQNLGGQLFIVGNYTITVKEDQFDTQSYVSAYGRVFVHKGPRRKDAAPKCPVAAICQNVRVDTPMTAKYAIARLSPTAPLAIVFPFRSGRLRPDPITTRVCSWTVLIGGHVQQHSR